VQDYGDKNQTKKAPMNGLRWFYIDDDDNEVVGASRHCQAPREIGPGLSDQGLAQRQTSTGVPLMHWRWEPLPTDARDASDQDILLEGVSDSVLNRSGLRSNLKNDSAT
jgi:hypothetical protein